MFMRLSALSGSGAFLQLDQFFYKYRLMSRLLIRQEGVLRRLASISATHDGSIKLNLVRNGVSESGWSWSNMPGEQGDVEKRAFTESRTKSITIHTSGRVNYHFDKGHTAFIPCLLDLETVFPILTYVIPDVSELDTFDAPEPQDHIVDVPDGLRGHLSFEFSVLPLVLPGLPGEIMRCGVEGLYGLSCVAQAGCAGVAKEGVPDEAFTTLRPQQILPAQTVREEVAFLRFKRAMFANDVRAAVENEPDQTNVPPPDVIEAMIAQGPGLFHPNSHGVWTYVTAVPMRVAPKLLVEFPESRYRAEVVEIRPGDTRLATVRVRFKVFDEKASAYVKSAVPIVSISLDAEL